MPRERSRPPETGAAPASQLNFPVGALPTNGELAGLLLGLADYLAFEGDSVYRVLAYRRAAAAFQEHPTSVAELALRGHLRTLPGVGEAIECHAPAGKAVEEAAQGRAGASRKLVGLEELLRRGIK